MNISDEFEGGNIEVIEASDPQRVQLRLRKDHQSDHSQWFFFRVTGVREQALRMQVLNAGEASYPDGWEGYRACASYDRREWFRVATRYEDGVLTIEHHCERDAVWFAYFAPYSLERHYDRISAWLGSDRVTHEWLGVTLDGQDLDLLHVRSPRSSAQPRKRVWVIARQHPGETMAEWLVEGLVDRLLDESDAIANALLERVELSIVPNMNPDGSRRGHLRTNAAGVNLNRAWREPSLERSPEVYLVRAKMQELGLDFALDVHGDEGLPYNFIAGPDGVASVTPQLFELQQRFEGALVRHCPDFQTEHGYPEPEPGSADLRMATNWISDHFGKLALTLEQPFKDNADRPDPRYGWSPARARKLGEALLGAMLEVVDAM